MATATHKGITPKQRWKRIGENTWQKDLSPRIEWTIRCRHKTPGFTIEALKWMFGA